MRFKRKTILAALVAVFALGAVASASASAAPPEFYLTAGESLPLVAEESSSTIRSQISEVIEAHECIGAKSKAEVTGVKTLAFAIELRDCKTSADRSCHTEGSEGELLSGTGTLVFISKAKDEVGVLFTLTPTTIDCFFTEKVQGSILIPIRSSDVDFKVENLIFPAITGNGSGKPTHTTYENAKGEEAAAKLEVNYGSGFKESALEMGEELTLKIKEGKTLTIDTEPFAPENMGLPVVSPAAPIQAVPESATTGTWWGEPTSYAYQWERCNATGGECKEISGATGSAYTPVEADVGHTLVVKVTAKSAGGSTSVSSKATSKVEPPASGPTEFVLGEGETFPVALENSAPTMQVEMSNPVEAIKCDGVKSSGSITSAKVLSLTIELKGCATAAGTKCATGAESGVEVFSGAGGELVYISKAENKVAVLFTLSSTAEITCGTKKAKVRGSILTPVTPVNTKTSTLDLAFTGNGAGKPTYTSYENEKGEAVKAKFESNFGSGYKESALEAGEKLELTASKSLTVSG